MAKNRLADMTMDYSDVAAEMFEDGVELDTVLAAFRFCQKSFFPQESEQQITFFS